VCRGDELETWLCAEGRCVKAGVEGCVERCGGYTPLRCELEWGGGETTRVGAGAKERERTPREHAWIRNRCLSRWLESEVMRNLKVAAPAANMRRRAAKRGGEAGLWAGIHLATRRRPSHRRGAVPTRRSAARKGQAPRGRHGTQAVGAAALQPFASDRITAQWAQSRLLDWQAILVKKGGAQRQRAVQNRHVECVMHTNLREVDASSALKTCTPKARDGTPTGCGSMAR
jgi:hypothetical protein